MALAAAAVKNQRKKQKAADALSEQQRVAINIGGQKHRDSLSSVSTLDSFNRNSEVKEFCNDHESSTNTNVNEAFVFCPSPIFIKI